ncbi:hypothetical protein [Salinigranum halophilum]|nr:hypothetical protein [Salinigranum halophilum]
MSRIASLLSRLRLRRVPRRCRANAWASVYAELYEADPRADGGRERE